MEDFHAQQVQMGTAKHLPLEKFEAIDMALDDAITPRQRACRSHSSVIPSDPIDKAPQFAHLALFSSLEPSIKRLDLAFFEQGHELLAQEVDCPQFIAGLADVLKLLPLPRRQFLGGQNHEKGSTARGKTTLPCRGCKSRFARFAMSRLGRKLCSP